MVAGRPPLSSTDVESLDLTPLHCGLGQEIHRLGMGDQEPFHAQAQRRVVAAGASQVIRSCRRRFLVQRGKKDRFDLRRSARRAFGVGEVFRLIRGAT